MAKHITRYGEVIDVQPADGKKFTLQELYSMVGSPVDIQRNPKGKEVMVVNDNGKLDGLDVNEKASVIWRQWYPIEEYPHNNDETIVGDVVVCLLREV